MGTRCRIATSWARRIFRIVSGHHEPGLDGGVVRDHDDLAALDHADAGDDAGTRRLAVVLVVRHQQPELEPRRARVEQALHPLPRGELALLVHPGDARGAAALLKPRGEPAILVAELPEPALLGLGGGAHGSASGLEVSGRPRLDVLDQIGGGGAGPEQPADAQLLERGHVLRRG